MSSDPLPVPGQSDPALLAALAAATNGILIADAQAPDQPLIYANDGFERITGYPVAAVLGRNCRFLQGVHTDQRAVAQMRAACDNGTPVSVELLNYRSDGSSFWNRISLSPVFDAQGEFVQIVGVMEDVTERRRAQEALRESTARLQSLIDTTAAVVYAKDLDGRFRLVNHAFELISGVDTSRAVGQAAVDLLPLPDELRRAEDEALEWQRDVEAVTSLETALGTRTFYAICSPWRDDQGEVIGVCVVATDVTETEALRVERDALTAQLSESRHLDALGRLAGGIAQDLGNLLAVMANAAEFVGRQATAPDVQADIAQIRDAARRATELTGQLRVLGRRVASDPAVHDVNVVVRDLEGLLRAVVGQGPTLELALAERGSLVHVDRTQLERVLVTLVVSAVDALADGRVVRIATSAGADTALIEVSGDVGAGTRDAADRAFEAFFSTDGPGAGDGLGLASARSSIEAAGGTLEITAAAGAGTTVAIVLPLARP